MDLSTINFSVNTKPLEAAAAVIGELVTNVGKLDKAARDAAQTEAVLAKAAKLNADANLQNAKAQDTRLKSTITADKADQQAAAAIERKTKATERASTAIKKNADMLQLQNDTYDFILEGFSKGDAKVLAMAKATGQLSDQLKQVLTDIRQFSKNTFDQTETGLDRMVKSAKEASSAQGFLNNGLNLTSKQAKELSNDLDRLNIRLQHQGKSYQEITKEQAIYKQRFVEEANSVNRATSALAAVEKQRKDVVSATNYLTQADQKMAAALNTSNAALDKAGTDSLVNYETALRKSGISQDVATAKLAKYKAQLEQVQTQEQKRREEHLTRALAPQATDVVVSLWSGQNPLTVLLQQGGQVTDLFMRSGVAAEKFGEVVKSSMKSMLPSILTVAKGIGGLLVDGFMAAGNAVSSFLAKSVGLSGALDKLYMKMSENGPSKWGGKIQVLSSLISGAFAGGVAAGTAVLVATGVALKQVIEENDNLARSMAQSGASMAISTSQAFAYAKSMNDVDISTGKAVVAITEMAKAGNFASSDIPKVTEAAVNLNKYLGVSIEDTVKAYSKLKDEPVKAILDLAKASGNIPPKIIETIVELERQGEVAKATSLAMTARFENDKKVIEDAKKNLSGFSTFVIKLGETIGNFFSTAFKNIWYATDPTDELQKNLDEVRKKIKDVSATLESNKSWGISGDPKLLNSLKEQERMIISQIGAQVRLRGEEEKRKFLNTENAKDQEAIVKIQKEALAFASKETEKTLSLEAFKKKFVDDKIKATDRQVELDKQTLDLLNKQAEAEYKKLHASGAKQTVKDLETEIDILNKRVGLTSSYNNELASLQRLRASGGITEQEYIHDVEELIKLQPFYIDQQKKVAEGQDLINKLLGKGEGLGKDYYDSMAKLESLKGTPGFDVKEIEAAQKALSATTPFAKAISEWFTKGREALEKYSAEFKKTRDDLSIQSDELDYQYSLLGKTEDQQKKITIEHQRQVKLLKAANEYEAERLKILNDKNIKNDEDRTAVMLQNDQAYAEKVRLINRETSLVYAQDLQKEFDNIRNGLTDSIVTALFEGGKAGSKKFRDIVVAQLRKPVTMVVNAVVNTLLGNVVGGLLGGGSAAGGTGSLLSTADGIGNLLGGLGSFGSTVAGGIGSVVGSVFGVGAGNVALGTSLGLGASSSTAAALAAAQAGGAAGGAGAAGMGSFLSGAGAAMPYIGAAIALISLISGMDDSGTYHTGGAARYSKGGGLTSGNSGAAFDIGFGQVETGKETISAMETLSKSLVEIFDGIAKTFGKTAGYEVAVAFADDTSKDGAWGAFAVRLQGVEILNWDDFRQSKWAPKEFGDGEEGYKQYLAAIAKDTRQVLTDMDIPGWAKTILNDIGENPSMESLSGAIQLLAQVETVFKSFGQYMPQFANLADSAKEALIRASGGVQALTGNMSSFVNAFYTDADKLEINTKRVMEAMDALGLPMVKTRGEFKALVESQMALGESGAANVAALLALSNAMDVVLPAFGEVETAVVGMSDTLRGLTEEANSLEIEILRLQGQTPEADARQRQTDTAGMSEAEIAAYDYNIALREQIRVQEARTNLEDRLFTLQNDSAAILARQRKAEYDAIVALDPALGALLQQIYAIEDASAAAANATAAANASAAAYFAVIDRADAERGFVNDAQSVLDSIYGSAQDASSSAASSAASNAASAATATADAWKSAVSSIKSYLEKLRADTLALAPPSVRYSTAKGTFNDYVSKALSGDSEAALKLTDAADAFLESSLKSSVTRTDYIRDRMLADIKLSSVLETGEAQVSVQEAIASASNAAVSELRRVNDNLTGFAGDLAIILRGGYGDASRDQANVVANSFAKMQADFDAYFKASTGWAAVGNTYTDAAFGGASFKKLDNNIAQFIGATGTIDYIRAGESLLDIAKRIPELRALWEQQYGIKLPALAVGTNYVPKDMPAMLHEGEAVVPKKFNPWVNTSSSNSSSDLVDEIRALRTEVQMLRAEARATAVNTGKTARMLDDVTQGGDAIKTVTA